MWADDRKAVSIFIQKYCQIVTIFHKLFQHLAQICRQLEALPSTPSELASFDSKRFRWMGRTHPWFPDLVS